LLGDISFGFSRLPWENLTKYLKKHGGAMGEEMLRLSEEVMSDHAAMGTGGTCFSLTNALHRIVTDLGFRAYPAMADMRHGENIHCALVVELDNERYLLDPGYLVAEPVPLLQERPSVVTQSGQFIRYIPAGDGRHVEMITVNQRGDETWRYRLRPAGVDGEEFLRHWVASFNANGMNGLHLNRISTDGRLSAHNYNLRIDDGRGKRNLKLRERYSEEVSARFGIDTGLVEKVLRRWETDRCR
jgi:arylamine N-acetyltransferase